jgi:hypothetical protein
LCNGVGIIKQTTEINTNRGRKEGNERGRQEERGRE